MRSKVVVLALAMIFSLLPSGGIVLATPTPPYILVNHSTHQCSETVLGDECVWCDPPRGWEVLGPSAVTQCPAGYTLVERVDLNCVCYKNQFCCSNVSHHGDCEDLIVNNPQKLCAFVADIVGCVLPEGWTKRPADVRESSWNCPYGYQWASDIACLVETATTEPTGTTGLTATAPTGTSTAVRTNVLTEPVYLSVLVVAGAFLVWFIARRAGRRSRRSS
jgi:hypothetical protein